MTYNSSDFEFCFEIVYCTIWDNTCKDCLVKGKFEGKNIKRKNVIFFLFHDRLSLEKLKKKKKLLKNAFFPSMEETIHPK